MNDFKVRLPAALLTAAALLVRAAQAQTATYSVDGFDPSGTGGNSYSAGQIGNVWGNWFGGALQSVSWDALSDASNNPNSGSMKIAANFTTDPQSNQFEIYDGFNGILPAISGLQYTNFQCDVRFDPGSATQTVNGTPIFGHIDFGIVSDGYGQDYFGGVDVPASNTNWVHVSINLNATADPNLLSISDVLIHIFGPYYSPALSGSSILWVDNIRFTGPAPVPTNCAVNWNDVHQRIDGFGASSAWASSFTTDQADMFFSTNTGIGLSLIRSRIAPDGTTGEASILQQAIARGARAWSTPWSPPAQYKDTNTVNGGHFLSSVANYQAYANELANYVANLKTNAGINLYAVSVQNEPDQSTTYESCLWTSQQIHDFVPYLSAALTNCGVPSTKILIAEFSNWNFDITTNTMQDANTAAMIGVMAAHGYGGTIAPVNTAGKPLWETEVSTLGGGYDGSMPEAMYWAGQIHSYLTVAQVNAWHYWWLISDNPDNEGLTDTSGNPAKRMYALGNFSRFVRPNYYRVGVSNNSPSILVSAFKDPASGCFAIVAQNPLTIPLAQTFNFANFTPASVTPWITSSNLSLASNAPVAVTASSLVYTLPAMSVVTFVGQTSNAAPTLAPVSSQTVNPGVALSITNTAADPNVPPQTLTFSLLSTPSNATLTQINSSNAVFAWRPLVSQANSTNSISVSVVDNGTSLAATNRFIITVLPWVQPSLGPVSLSNGHVSLMVTGALGPDYTLWTSTNLITWTRLLSSNPATLPVTLADTNARTDPARFYRVQIGP